ncbi:hypothetical protein B0H13DRAFT_1876167 [Mycena leptocephala]|nr:hypothetical protein B0H13DRAFT_1876167 [Mycena leptocephala]
MDLSDYRYMHSRKCDVSGPSKTPLILLRTRPGSSPGAVQIRDMCCVSFPHHHLAVHNFSFARRYGVQELSTRLAIPWQDLASIKLATGRSILTENNAKLNCNSKGILIIRAKRRLFLSVITAAMNHQISLEDRWSFQYSFGRTQQRSAGAISLHRRTVSNSQCIIAYATFRKLSDESFGTCFAIEERIATSQTTVALCTSQSCVQESAMAPKSASGGVPWQGSQKGMKGECISAEWNRALTKARKVHIGESREDVR